MTSVVISTVLNGVSAQYKKYNSVRVSCNSFRCRKDTPSMITFIPAARVASCGRRRTLHFLSTTFRSEVPKGLIKHASVAHSNYMLRGFRTTASNANRLRGNAVSSYRVFFQYKQACLRGTATSRYHYFLQYQQKSVYVALRRQYTWHCDDNVSMFPSAPAEFLFLRGNAMLRYRDFFQFQ